MYVISILKLQFLRLISPLFKNFKYSNLYKLDGARNLDPHYIFKIPFAFPLFRFGYKRFKKQLLKDVSSKNSTSYYKFGDGDFHFLSGNKHGSAAPGNRALSRKLTPSELKVFQTRAQYVDHYMCELYPHNRLAFYRVIRTNKKVIPAEYAYASVATRWVFREFKNSIGLIGSASKLELIREMMKFQEYRDYLGIEEFSDYITVPQKFSCDDLPLRIEELTSQLQKSKSKIFLIGVGHLKSGVLSELPKIKNSVYLDVGTGIDAIAGIIDPKRPFFGHWCNFYIPGHPIYNKIDFLNFNNENKKSLIINQ